MADNLVFEEVKTAGLVNRYEKSIKVMRVTGGPGNGAAFIYQCVLNRDLDGAADTYGLDNPNGENTLKDAKLQAKLKPLDHLGNACGDPGDGTKGFKNFENGSNNFYWASIISIPKSKASKRLVIDERSRVEAGRAGPIKDPKNPPPLLDPGQGFFPVIQITGKTRGYYISATATNTISTLSDTNPEKWVDGSSVPYAVRATNWLKLKAGGKNIDYGDFGLAINNVTGQSCGFFFGDGGTTNRVGESSGKLFDSLGGTDAQLVSFIVFPGSGSGKEVGKDPQDGIGKKVLTEMLKICSADNALELPMRLAFSDLAIPTKQAEMTVLQANTYKNVASALRSYGNWPKK